MKKEKNLQNLMNETMKKFEEEYNPSSLFGCWDTCKEDLEKSIRKYLMKIAKAMARNLLNNVELPLGPIGEAVGYELEQKIKEFLGD